jgi:SAM-dependent methyltransferase
MHLLWMGLSEAHRGSPVGIRQASSTRLFVISYIGYRDTIRKPWVSEKVIMQIENPYGQEPISMPAYDNATYGDRIAHRYDDFIQIPSEQTLAAVETLASLANSGPVLELGIGTGRVALPLHQKGIAVHGIDASQRMVDELRKKAGGNAISITIGDLADVAVEGQFTLVYVVFNTIFTLLTQEAQVRCFANVANHLQSDGLFVIEAFVPDPPRFTGNQNVVASKVDVDEVRLDVTRYDPLHQRLNAQHLVIANGTIQTYPIQLRYAWPSELDLMAQLAGLTLRERWSSWQRSPFTSQDTAHISLYQSMASLA